MRKRKNIKLRVKNLIEKYNTKNPYMLCKKMNILIKFINLEKNSYYLTFHGHCLFIICGLTQ